MIGPQHMPITTWPLMGRVEFVHTAKVDTANNHAKSVTGDESGENECPTEPKVLKHSTKFTFGWRKQGSKSAQLQSARERRQSAPKPVTVASPIPLPANPSTVPGTLFEVTHSAS